MAKKSKVDSNNIEVKIDDDVVIILKQAAAFLELFLPKTLAKRFIALILLAVGIPVKTAIGLSGLSERSLWTLHKQLSDTGVSEIMVYHHRGGHPEKAVGLEKQILAELEAGSYHTRQEISDMVSEKFGIKMSRSAVGRFLKKTALNG